MTWDFILRLFVAGAFGTVIGLDREYRVKDAGFRTHFLVSLGSALIMIVSQYGFSEILTRPGVGLDPSRIAAQVVSGIGFIGAGTIIFHRQIVRGLTTAASLWATAGIGLAVGAGMYAVAAAATVLTLVALEGLTLIFRGLGLRRTLVVFSAPGKDRCRARSTEDGSLHHSLVRSFARPGCRRGLLSCHARHTGPHAPRRQPFSRRAAGRPRHHDRTDRVMQTCGRRAADGLSMTGSYVRGEAPRADVSRHERGGGALLVHRSCRGIRGKLGNAALRTSPCGRQK